MMETGTAIRETRIFTQADFDAFARLSGDDNPIHVDPVFATSTRFGRTVAHGMFLYGIICAVLNQHFPGTVQLEQSLRFPAPTYADEPVDILINVKQQTGQTIHLTTQIVNDTGDLTCDGECVLRYE